MTRSILSMIFLLSFLFTEAQVASIVVCKKSGNAFSSYQHLDSAIMAASSGDYIYIPGGTFSISVPISKRLNLIGVGFNPDSNQATGVSIINGDIVMSSGSDSSIFQGFELNGTFSDAMLNDTIRQVKIEYVKLNGFSYHLYYRFEEFYIHNCIFKNHTVYYGGNSFFSNCLFVYSVNLVFNSEFDHCVFMNTPNMYAQIEGFANCHQSTYRNSVFFNLFGYGIQYGESNGISSINNLYVTTGANLFQVLAINSFAINLNNVIEQCNEAFLNCPVVNSNNEIQFQLDPSSQGKGSGDDNTDRGIFGGYKPWKMGAFPDNPHISLRNIGNATNIHGDLPVIIKARITN